MRYFRYAIAPIVFALSACSSAPPKGHYKIPVDQAYAKLVAAPFADFVKDRQCGILIHVIAYAESNFTIHWRVFSSASEMLYFKARLTPVDAGTTKVEIEVGPNEWNGREAYDGSQFYTRPAVLQPVRPAIEEQIGTILNDRPYNDKQFLDAKLKDKVCSVQQGGLAHGHPFTINDEPGGAMIRSPRPKNSQ